MARHGPGVWLRWTVFGLALAAFGGVAHTSHRRVDELRFAPDARPDRVAPDGQVLAVASLGQRVLVGDLLWVRTILAFADIYETPDPLSVSWVRSMVDAVIVLDPQWRTSYFYGGTLMRVLGDIDSSDRVFRAGHAALPNDPFFPFSIGMNAYLHRDDIEGAAPWLAKAAELPGAPAWYRAALAGLMEEGGTRRAALDYLDRQLQEDQKPQVRKALVEKRRALLHDELVDRITEHRGRFQRRFGRDIRDISELGDLPDDPYQVGWVLAPDGVIRSQFREDFLRQKAVADERQMLLLPLVLRDP